MREWQTVSLLLLPLLVCSCTVGPNYRAPVVNLVNQWETPGADRRPAELCGWWERFDDPTLNALISEARCCNLDLKQACARVIEVRALRAVAASERYPSLDASVACTYEDWNLRALPRALQFPTPTRLLFGGLSASWELDLFGRIRRSVEAATADLQASVEDLRDVLVSLFAEVATNYIELRTLQARIAYAEGNTKLQRKTLDLTEKRLAAGVIAEVDEVRARSNLYNSEAQIPPLRASLAAVRHRLAVLLGKQPGTVGIDLDSVEPIPTIDLDIATGIPCDLVRQRPDIRRAERELASRTALIGVATTELYPQFSLVGSLTGANIPLLGNGYLDFTRWSVGPSMFWRLFAGGQVRANIKGKEASAQQACFSYQQTVLQAIEEVDNALSFMAEETAREAALQEAVRATERSVELVQLTYQEGLTDFQSVLDAERSLFTQQDQFAASEGEVVKFAISLYKALGGGW